MSNRDSRLLLSAVGLMVAACSSATDPSNDGTCQQTYEFGNFGCARFVVLLEGPPEPWPTVRRGSVQLVSINSPSVNQAIAYDPGPGLNTLEFTHTRWSSLDAVDTMSVYIKATLVDAGESTPQPRLATDSVRRLMRITPVGSRPVVDTVRLTLRWQ